VLIDAKPNSILIIMKAYIINKEDVNKFANKIIEKYPTVAAKRISSPVILGKKIYDFFYVEDANEISLEYDTTLLPPKNYIFRINEDLYEYDRKDENVILSEKREVKKQVLFGLHACDINAIRWIDIFYSKDYKDPYYWAKREKTLIVGISCIPSENCFCESWGMDSADLGFDLFLWDIGDKYFVDVKSVEGDKLIRLGCELFSDANDEDSKKVIKFINERKKMFKRHVDTSNFSQLLSLTWDKKVHEKWGKMCFGCGPCVFVCPTCFCYNLEDKVEFKDVSRGKKVKSQDACVLYDYSQIAGEYNFRPTQIERLRYRHYCKTKYTRERYGLASCVGCGRCIDACPAYIDIVKFMEDVRAGYGIESKG
jgi:sulfhydrogenase subunit beta (sulfur reductase)